MPAVRHEFSADKRHLSGIRFSAVHFLLRTLQPANIFCAAAQISCVPPTKNREFLHFYMFSAKTFLKISVFCIQKLRFLKFFGFSHKIYKKHIAFYLKPYIMVDRT